MSKFSILVNREHLLSQNYIPQNLTEPAIPFSAPPGDAKRLLVRDAAAPQRNCFTVPKRRGYTCGASQATALTPAKESCTRQPS